MKLSPSIHGRYRLSNRRWSELEYWSVHRHGIRILPVHPNLRRNQKGKLQMMKVVGLPGVNLQFWDDLRRTLKVEWVDVPVPILR